MKDKNNKDKFKLVISDIDGTLKCSNQSISEFTKNVVDEIRSKGLFFTLASGRNLSGAKDIAEDLKVDLPLVLSNGCILQKVSGEILHRALMPEIITKRVIEITDEFDYDLVLFVDDQLFFKTMTANIEPIFGHIPDACHEINEWKNIHNQLGAVNKCMILERSFHEKLAALEDIFEKEFSNKADFYRTNINHLEVMPRGISKAIGLQKLIEFLGIKIEEVIAFGDYDNDAELLAAAGLGIAVENATENVKSNADYVIGSCSEDAPAKFLRKMFL